MIRRVVVHSSGRVFLSVFLLAFCAVYVHAQSNQARSGNGPGFLTAPFISLSANPTSIAVGDLNSDGKLDLVVTKQGSGNVTVLLGDGKGGFAPAVEYAAGAQPGNALLADLNADGKLDLVVTDSASGTVNVLLGNGDGTFGKPSSYAALQNPIALALGNFAGKGKIDLAVASSTGLAVLLNDGSGHFPTATSLRIGAQPASLTTADLKGASHDDLLLANADGSVSVLLGDGTGNFMPLTAQSVASGPLSSIVAGDFNGDGKPDIAITQPNSSTLTVLLGRGDGTFQAGASYAVGNRPVSVRAVNLTGNGVTDLITVNRAANTFSVLLGNGDGTFKPAADFVAGNSPLALAAGDFNGDGHPDLAIVNSQDGTVSVPLGLGDGSFIAAPAYKSELETRAIASGDLNGDGLPDLVVTNYCGSDSACASAGSATVFLANKDGSYRAASTIALGSGPVAVALADLNGDKKLDLVALNRNDKTMMVMPGNGDGTFGPPQVYSLPSSPSALFVGDFNGDKIPDLAIASDCGQTTCTEPGSVEVWLGRGDGSLAASASYPVGYSPVSIAAGDLHGTGHLDLVIANACGDDGVCQSDGTATLLVGDGTGKFTSGGGFDIGKSPSAIAIGNLSGSGLDLAVAQRGSNQVAVFHANSSGSFGAPAIYPVGSAPSSLAIADFNGDGKQDLAVANFQSSTVSVLNGTGSGPLQAAQTYAAATGPESLVAIGNGAGHPASLASANGNSGANPLGNEITLFKIQPQANPPAGVSVSVSPATGVVDQSEVLTAALTGAANTPPTGNVTFSSAITANVVCTESTDVPQDGTVPSTTVSAAAGTATATCTTTSLEAGSDTISATLDTDPNFTGGSGSTSLTIDPAATSTSVASSTGGTSTVDDSVTFTATVSAPAGATVALSGNVTFTDNGSAITNGSACGAAGVVPITWNAASATGTAACTTSALIAGTHAIIATYGNDTNYTTSNNFVVQTVNHAGGTMTFTSSSTGDTSVINQSVTLTATITPSTSSTVVPLSGTVTFTDNGGPIAGCVVSFSTSTGIATCTTSSLALGAHPLKATYSGDPSYSFTPPTLTQTVNQAGTTTALASSSPLGTSPAVPTSAVNQSVTFTATVTPAFSGATALSGSVTFVDTTSSTTLCSSVAVLPSTGVATCTTSSLALGEHTIKATYGSDTNFSGSNNTVTQNVVTGSTSVALSASPSSTSTVNQTVVFIATVTTNPSGGTALDGTVAFTDNGAPIAGCSAVAPTSGVANCSDPSLTAAGSPHTIKATYGSDTNFAGSSTTLTQTVNQAATTVSLVASPNPSNVNQAVTLTATVSPANGSIALSGSVTFADNGGAVAGCTVSFNAATGIATCTTSSLTLGSHPLTATYGSDLNFKTSSGSVTQTVSAATTTVALTSSSPGGTSTVNQTVQFTATVTAPSGSSTLDGTVQFTDNGTTITGCSTQGLTSGVATCSDSGLTAGVHTIGALYSHDTNFGPSSATFSQTVNQGTSAVSLSASPGASTTVNQAVTFTATVSASPTGAIPLSATGTVTFTDSVTSAPILGCSTLPLSVTGDTGTAACTTSALTLGSHTITATFASDPNFGSSNKTLLQTVTQGSTSLSLGSSVPSSAINEPVTFTARVTPSPSGAIALSGKVSFTDTPQGESAAAISGCTNVALVIVSGVAEATCTSSSLILGSHTITATYGSDTNFSGSSGTFTQTVSAATSSIALTSSAGANTSTVNQTVVFTASIPVPNGSTTLTGTVAFTDNGTTICSAVKPSPVAGTNNWTAPCTDTSLTVTGSPHTIAATYSGDANFSVNSGSLTQTVNPGSTTVSLASTQNPSVVNNSVTFTAAVTPNPSGAVALSGKVGFVDSVTTQPIAGCSAVGLTVVGGNSEATCTTTALTVGAHTITATYASDANFNGNTATFIQTINTATSSITVASSTGGASIVNQSVMFTATIPVPTGAPNPSGTVSFTDNGASITVCTGVHPTLTAGTNNWTAACTDQSLIAGAHTVTASYGGDVNLTVGSGSTVQQVAQGQSQTVLTSNLSPAFLATGNSANFKDSVIFTATVSVVPPPGSTVVVPLSVGTVSFSVNGIAICTGAALTSGVATCATSTTAAAGFTDGPNGVVATYTGDPNYQTSNGPFNQLIEDYAISVSPVPANAIGVLVTQGFTTANDPFAPAALSVTSVSTAGFTGSPALTCAGSGSGAPTCGFASTSATSCQATATLPIAASGVQQSIGVCVDATKATPGTYAMTMTATDPTTSIVRTATFPVTVRALSAPLTLVSGATTNNTAALKFELPANVSLTLTNSTSSNTGSCSLVMGPELSGSVSPQTLFINCSFTPTSVPSSASPQTASVTATIATGSGTTSSLDGRSTLFFAGLLGIPVFGLFGLLGGRKSTRTIFLRLLAVVAICLTGWQISGCGGSFHGSTTVTNGGQTPPGAYYVLVTGTGSDGNTYEAVIQLNVTL